MHEDFHQLERRRIRDILLVSSLFDFYLFEEEGLLYEQIQSEYHGFQLSHTPELTRISSGAEALELLDRGERFDLIITTLHIDDMTPPRLAREIRAKNRKIPIVLLAYDKRELSDLITHHGVADFDGVFIWQGDFRLLIAIIKNLEDELNVADDTSRFGVQVILVNEDSVRYASFFLPLLYSEVMSHSQSLMSEGLNPAHRALRMRARPKILLSSTWEKAMGYLEQYEHSVIGVITDAGFTRGGVHDSRAGIAFTRQVKQRFWDIPILVQSTNPTLVGEAQAAGAMFLAKGSPTFRDDVGSFLRDYFGFGDFVFRARDGTEVGRAKDLKSLEEQLRVVPDESLLHHGSRNDFSNWFKARTEFQLAERLRPRKVSDYDSVAELREDIIRQLREHRSLRQRGMLTVFSSTTFDPASSFARTGGGSVGGKARGLAFLNTLLSMENLRTRFDGLDIEVPAGLVIGTDVFDQFLRDNDLRSFALSASTDEEIMHRFIAAERFPQETVDRLRELRELIREPLAVRSSSLLEDTQFHPFAGIYQTYMIPNSSLEELLTAIKRVYASTFYRAARDYIKVTSLRVEDEKMAVIVQRMVGAPRGQRFYPEISGVARSYNFYPAGPQKPEDGIAAVALGLGKTIVEGGATVRFCPKYPDHMQQFLRDTQRTFYALEMGRIGPIGRIGPMSPIGPISIEDERIVPFDLKTAEDDNTLHWVASTYSAENDALYDGISRAGTRVVTFAPILRHRLIPLAEALDELCRIGTHGIGTPVEIEFAVDLSGESKRLGLLQMRPLVLSREMDELNLSDIPAERLICQSDQVLGHGVIRDLRDIVVVGVDTFQRSRSHDAAREVAKLNSRLLDERRGYLLIGPGRWGSLDPLLGIPVKWDQICGARTIVEAGFRDLSIDPSQGSHFFQNLTAFQIGYFSVSPRVRNSFVDWDWLAAQRAIHETQLVRHIRLEEGVTVKMNGRERRGVILKANDER
ncbi:MAG TPA: PEP/pyruvate-binding domain-containing protein [Thermoanaerobaculia bacterium]|jgi:CheY-like chemotaxis protein|nr:PEP/pyruvate-binding domain-containing protein [Thermoanaerobaculia bacterium]